jgi:hypothetical protein
MILYYLKSRILNVLLVGFVLLWMYLVHSTSPSPALAAVLFTAALALPSWRGKPSRTAGEIGWPLVAFGVVLGILFGALFGLALGLAKPSMLGYLTAVSSFMGGLLMLIFTLDGLWHSRSFNSSADRSSLEQYYF